jgi:hypothetical protein
MFLSTVTIPSASHDRQSSKEPATPSLRTAVRKKRRTTSGENEAVLQGKGRRNHTEIEMKYCTRLNSFFERLLEILARLDDDASSDRDIEGVDPCRRTSKAEVLLKARRYICEFVVSMTWLIALATNKVTVMLEEQAVRMEDEKQQLKDKIGKMEYRVQQHALYCPLTGSEGGDF